MTYELTATGKVRYACPECGEGLANKLEQAGRSDRCPVCGAQHEVPGKDALKEKRRKAAERQAETERKKAVARVLKEDNRRLDEEYHKHKVREREAATEAWRAKNAARFDEAPDDVLQSDYWLKRARALAVVGVVAVIAGVLLLLVVPVPGAVVLFASVVPFAFALGYRATGAILWRLEQDKQ